MVYRREIDGLRALAVLPVIFFHAGFEVVSGGFIGVDIFFVISGYLITTILVADLKANEFSLIQFYERRARRILPALFLVMSVCTLLGYIWMMPDELKNFGQSLVATSVFCNNILLAVTSGYWDLAGEFKPLLHTWSLGVEEQYYIIFPLVLMLAWRYLNKNVMKFLWVILVLSLIAAQYGVMANKNISFYILPTRTWEIIVGAVAAIYIDKKPIVASVGCKNDILSFIGLLLIFFSIFFLDKNSSPPGVYMLIPTVGAVLFIIFAVDGTIANRFLGGKVFVGIGLISYSLYLWHQPILAFCRIYSRTQPSAGLNFVLIALSCVPAYLTWRFVEQPFRDKKVIGRGPMLYFTAACSLFFISLGYFLNDSYGVPSRAFDSEVKIEDMDKRAYNQKVFDLRKDYFSSPSKLKILVVGNSFGRDFVNITTETFDLSNIEIVYREDLSYCIYPFATGVSEGLFFTADVIVFAIGGLKPRCIDEDIGFARDRGKSVFYVGTKHFGYNLNWIIRLDHGYRQNQYNPIPSWTLEKENDLSAIVPAENFISLLSPVVKNSEIPITDERGRMLSTDRAHLTKYGAVFFGKHAVLNSRYGDILTRTQEAR